VGNGIVCLTAAQRQGMVFIAHADVSINDWSGRSAANPLIRLGSLLWLPWGKKMAMTCGVDASLFALARARRFQSRVSQKSTQLTDAQSYIIWRVLGVDQRKSRPASSQRHQQVHSQGLFVEKPCPSPAAFERLERMNRTVPCRS
jgi:hypothetical protein